MQKSGMVPQTRYVQEWESYLGVDEGVAASVLGHLQFAVYCSPVADVVVRCLDHRAEQHGSGRTTGAKMIDPIPAAVMSTTHWLPVQQTIDYKVDLLTFKVRAAHRRHHTSIACSTRERTSTTYDQPPRRCADHSTRRSTIAKRVFPSTARLSGTRYQRPLSTVTLFSLKSSLC